MKEEKNEKINQDTNKQEENKKEEIVKNTEEIRQEKTQIEKIEEKPNAQETKQQFKPVANYEVKRKDKKKLITIITISMVLFTILLFSIIFSLLNINNDKIYSLTLLTLAFNEYRIKKDMLLEWEC